MRPPEGCQKNAVTAKNHHLPPHVQMLLAQPRENACTLVRNSYRPHQQSRLCPCQTHFRLPDHSSGLGPFTAPFTFDLGFNINLKDPLKSDVQYCSTVASCVACEEYPACRRRALLTFAIPFPRSDWDVPFLSRQHVRLDGRRCYTMRQDIPKSPTRSRCISCPPRNRPRKRSDSLPKEG